MCRKIMFLPLFLSKPNVHGILNQTSTWLIYMMYPASDFICIAVRKGNYCIYACTSIDPWGEVQFSIHVFSAYNWNATFFPNSRNVLMICKGRWIHYNCVCTCVSHTNRHTCMHEYKCKDIQSYTCIWAFNYTHKSMNTCPHEQMRNNLFRF